ncbi:solute carrier family 49 member 4 isoform X2 [Rhinatrema bivittatum]|uniref:solute carrier family 49 member 4 isoform X2 n=1 Tax=Rhinatrema bivittatum TaxID=194408 RepID=UPI001125B91F|nr:solute carrier family 49 member 4 isoform X2 [Rhinatrema bivittatum]
MGLDWSSPEEREALLGPPLPPRRALPAAPGARGRVYSRRWLVLFLFSLLGFLQGLMWNSWGPIQNSAKAAYGFSSVEIALLVLWGPIGFLACFFFMWLMDKKGLRLTVLLTAFLMVAGAGLKCVPVTDTLIKRRLIHAGQLLNGLGSPTVINAAPFLSMTWFSPDERTTATAIAGMVNYLGGACAFLVGPLVVPAPNKTLLLPSPGHVGYIRDRIEAVMYAEFGFVSLIFAAALAFFPARPPVPPSMAAASRRLGYRSSICKLLRSLCWMVGGSRFDINTSGSQPGGCRLDWILVHSGRLRIRDSYCKVCRFYQRHAKTHTSAALLRCDTNGHMVHADHSKQCHPPAFNVSYTIHILHIAGSLSEQQHTDILRIVYGNGLPNSRRNILRLRYFFKQRFHGSPVGFPYILPYRTVLAELVPDRIVFAQSPPCSVLQGIL